MNTVITLVILGAMATLCWWIHKKLRKWQLPFIASAVIAFSCATFLPIVLFLAIGSMIGWGDSSPTPDNNQNQQQVTSPGPTPIQASNPVDNSEPKMSESSIQELDQEKIFNITPEQFRQKYNNVMAELEIEERIPKLNIKKGKVNDVFSVLLSKNHGINGTIDKKTGKLKYIVVVCTFTDDPSNEVMVAALIAASADKVLGGPKEKQFIIEMFTEALKKFNETKQPVEIIQTVGSNEYMVTLNQATGLWLIISPKP